MENHQPKRPASAGTQTNGIYEEIIRHLATTREGREFIAGLVPALVRLWADSGADAGFARDAVRRGVAGIAEGSIKNTFLDPRAFHQAPSLSTLGSDPDFMQHACRQLERSLDAACDTLSDVLAKMETLNTDGKKAILTALFSSLGGGRTANAITSACRVINDIHTDDPHFLAAILRPGFEKWIENLDFAEIKDFLDSGT